MHEKKSLFELNEKVLRSSFKIIFGVRTARVFELKKNLPYPNKKYTCTGILRLLIDTGRVYCLSDLSNLTTGHFNV